MQGCSGVWGRCQVTSQMSQTPVLLASFFSKRWLLENVASSTRAAFTLTSSGFFCHPPSCLNARRGSLCAVCRAPAHLGSRRHPQSPGLHHRDPLARISCLSQQPSSCTLLENPMLSTPRPPNPSPSLPAHLEQSAQVWPPGSPTHPQPHLLPSVPTLRRGWGTWPLTGTKGLWMAVPSRVQLLLVLPRPCCPFPAHTHRQTCVIQMQSPMSSPLPPPV